MRSLIAAACALAVCVAVAAAVAAAVAGAGEIPPLVYCFVDPWDDMDYPCAVGIPDHREGVLDPSQYADITVTILDDDYQPLPGLYVEVIISSLCVAGADAPVCICEDAELTGYTNDDGQVSLNIALGGCCEDPWAVEIIANGLWVYLVDMIVSPDWNLEEGDCSIDLADFITFGTAFHVGASGCTDLTGSGGTGLTDFIVFSAGWMRDCTVQ